VNLGYLLVWLTTGGKIARPRVTGRGRRLGTSFTRFSRESWLTEIDNEWTSVRLLTLHED